MPRWACQGWGLGTLGTSDLRIIPYAAGDSGILVPQKPAIPIALVFFFLSFLPPSLPPSLFSCLAFVFFVFFFDVDLF